MKLVTYDEGKVGRVDGDEIVRLDVPTMREYFERGGGSVERAPGLGKVEDHAVDRRLVDRRVDVA